MNIFRTIERGLLDAILQGQLKPGETLPTEASLMDDFSASRVTVRRALSELKDLSIVSATAGRGTEVLSRKGGFGCELDLIVLVAPVQSPFFTSLMAPLDSIAGESEAVMLYKHDFSGQMLSDPEFYLKLLDRGVRNLVLWPHVSNGDWSLLDRLRTVGMNLVVVDQSHETAAADVVAIDADSGTRALIEKLRSRAGAGPIWMLAHDPELPSEHARQDAFRKWAGEDCRICLTPRFEDDGFRDLHIEQLIADSLKQKRPPAAFLCSHGGLGLSTARALKKRNKAKATVATFDYTESMDAFSLFALKQPFETMATAIFKSLVQQSQHPKKWRAKTRLFEGEIIATGRYS